MLIRIKPRTIRTSRNKVIRNFFAKSVEIPLATLKYNPNKSTL